MCKGPVFLVAPLCLHPRLHRQFKVDLFTVLYTFTEKAVQLHGLYVPRRSAPSITHLPGRNDGWKAFLLDFSSSVEHVTRQSIDFGVSSQDHDTATKEELESLRYKVDELSDEVGPSL